MKTATLETYHIYGTTNEDYVTVLYRGTVLHSVNCHHSETTMRCEQMKVYAARLGFTHYKLSLNGERFPLPT